MIFRNMLGKVLEGLSNFSPVKNLIKYILDRSLNQLLSNQISLEDFKNGELFLTNISLNLEKINRDYLLSSPYILHRGEVRRLKITLPSWSELSSKSIEITAEGLQIDLKPNKQFADNFKEAMREQHTDIYQQEEPGGIDNPLDFFRQLVKQIILNMKIRVENSAIRLFLNEPTRELAAKPQYYLMLRLPLVSVGKSDDLIIPNKEESQEIKFDLLIPQLSFHLLKEATHFPEFLNQKASKDDFPFTYPPLHHPTTILLVGQATPLPAVDKQKITKLTITLTTFFKKQKKLTFIDGKIGSFEATIDPIQLKVISRFFAQLAQFQRILKSVMTQLGLNTQVPLSMSRKDSKGKSGTHDFFSSIMMSIAQPATKQPSTSPEAGMYTSMMQQPEMIRAAEEFNQNAVQQLRSSGNFEEEGFKNINFKNQLRVKFGLRSLQANLLKYVTASVYEREWGVGLELGAGVNERVGCSHYRLLLRCLQYSFQSGKSLHQVEVGFVQLQDARLKNQQSFHLSTSEQFYDIDSSTFYNTNVNQDYFTPQPELLPFRLAKDQHYCLEELFRLSEGQEAQVQSERVKTYAFMPKGAQCGAGAGVRLSFNADSKALKVQVKDVAVMANFQVWKDILNMLYPVFLYRKLYQKINLQTPQMPHIENEPPKNADFFQSQYRFSGQLVEEEAKEQGVEVRVRVGLVYCFYREATGLKGRVNLCEDVERKILDSDNFSKHCFCCLNERGVYAEIKELQWQQIGQQFNLSIAQIRAGMLAVTNSQIQEDIRPILIIKCLRVEQYSTQGKTGETLMRSRIFVPKACFVVQLPILISFIDMSKKLIAVVDSLLNFKKYLSAKQLVIEQQLLNRPKIVKEKVQKQRVLEVLVGEVELKMLLLSTCLRGVFFRKRGGEIEVKLESMGVGLSRQLDIRLGQFRNQMVTEQYPKSEKYSGIIDTHLILEVGRECKARVWGVGGSEVKGKGRRLQRKLDFFEGLEKEEMSLRVMVRERTQSGKEKKINFKFDKARKNSIIEEEKTIKKIEVLPLILYLHAGNLAFLLLHKKEIQDLAKEVGEVLQEIKQDSKELMQRKDSDQSESTPTTEIALNLKDLRVNIDVKPDFSYNQQAGQRVLSNTRMFLSIVLQNLEATSNPDSQQLNLSLHLSAVSYFLTHPDKDIELNPLFLALTDLDALGFRKIADISGVSLKGSLNGKSKVGEFEVGVDSIIVDMCLTTIPLLQLFLSHFTRHSLAGDYGGDEDSDFIVLDGQTDQEPQDLTERLEQYERLLQQKKKALNQFSIREFGVRESDGSRMVLKSLRVGVMKVKLFGGSQFKFIQCNSMYESKATSRNRSEHPDLMNYIALTLENFKIKAEQNQKNMQSLFELERLELQLSYRRREGLLWGADKDFTSNLLKINSPLRAMAQISQEYLKVKLHSLEMTVNITDQLFSITDQFSKAVAECDSSPWRRHYSDPKVKNIKVEVSQKMRMLLMILPEGRISASAQFKRAKLLSQRVLRLQELVVHQEQSNSQRIVQLFHDWALKVFTSNLGTLVSGALFEVLSTCIGLLFGGIRHILAIFFPKLKD